MVAAVRTTRATVPPFAGTATTGWRHCADGFALVDDDVTNCLTPSSRFVHQDPFEGVRFTETGAVNSRDTGGTARSGVSSSDITPGGCGGPKMWVGSRRGPAHKSRFPALVGDIPHRSPRPTKDSGGDDAYGHRYGRAYGLK